MFRLHRRDKSVTTKSGEKLGFKFSNFQATHVPKGWDGLLVSIVSLETGKTTAKSSKATVRNGSCQWTETLSESIWISQDDSSKELEECLFKFVVSMGSARPGILGEVIINMTDYMKSRTFATVTFPLKKCSHGTTLQVKIHCLTPRSNLSRENKSKDSNFASEDLYADCPQMDAQYDRSDTTYVNSHTSASSKETESTALPRELGSRETSFSASSRLSSDSTDSPRNNLNGDLNDPIGRQDSSSSRHSAPHGSYSVDDTSRSNHSSFNTRITGSGNNSLNAPSSLRNSGSSRNLLEAAEDTIDAIRAEAKMWERNARKLMVDLEIVKKEFSELSKKQADTEIKLSAANTEVDGLKKEVEQLKVSLEEPRLNQTWKDEPTNQAKGGSEYRKELEKEMKFQEDTNDRLSLQLTRSQESNIELVSVLQELEETIETQKREIEKLSTLEAKINDMENNIQEHMDTNKFLTLELQQKKEAETDFLARILSLEKSLEEKSNNLENERHLNHQRLLKDEELASLEVKSFDTNLVGEMEALKEKVQELEKDCNELTDENLELILKIKDLESSPKYISSSESEASDCKSQVYHPEEEIKKKNNGDQFGSSEISRVLFELSDQLEMAFGLIKKPWYDISSPHDSKFVLDGRIKLDGLDTVSRKEQAEAVLSSIVKLNKALDARIVACEKALINGEADRKEKTKQIVEVQKELEDYISKANGFSLSVEELESMKIELETRFDNQGKVMNEQKNETVKLEADVLSKDKEISILRQSQSVFEQEVSDLSSSVDSHVSAYKVLERKSSELQRKKVELELQLSELEQQNLLLSEHISSLEAQLKHTKDEKIEAELDNAKSLATSLQDEIVQLGVEMETQRVYLNQKLQDIQNQWLKGQQECENLKIENSNLKARSDSLENEKSNENMRKENLELNLHCTQLKFELNEAQKAFGNCSNRVVLLEENISALVHDYAGKEKALNSELNGLTTEKNSLNQLYQEKKLEVETLQKQIEHLNQQLSSFKDEGERVSSNEVHEAIGLRENAKLESALLEVQSQLKQAENELIQTESKTKVQSLITELAALQQIHDLLKAANEKMSNLLQKYKSSEDKNKTNESDLELKVTISEHENQKLLEEITRLKVQIQKVDHLQDEILVLTNAFNAMKIDKEKLEASLTSLSSNCDELRGEQNSYLEKISILQKTVIELEDYKQSRVDLEEKLLRMEGDLNKKDALGAQEAELKNDLSRMKSANRQLQWKIQELEEEKRKCGKRAQTLEDEIKLLKEEKKDRNEANGKRIPVLEDMRHSKGDNGHGIHNGSSLAIEVDPLLKIQVLENELAEALETNKFYKNQLNSRVLLESRNDHQDNPRQSKSEEEVVPKERVERTQSSLQAELRDLRDRYLDMSLKYAEVESQREELVMKLKKHTSGKRRGFFN